MFLSKFFLSCVTFTFHFDAVSALYKVLSITLLLNQTLIFLGKNQVSLIGNQSKCRWCYYSSPLTLCSEHIYALHYDKLLSCLLAVEDPNFCFGIPNYSWNVCILKSHLCNLLSFCCSWVFNSKLMMVVLFEKLLSPLSLKTLLMIMSIAGPLYICKCNPTQI